MSLKGMALAPWSVLAGGKIRTDEEEEKRRKTGENGRTIFGQQWERTEEEKKICKALEKVAAEVGAKHITSGVSAILSVQSLILVLILDTQLPLRT
jgi:aryl-alcohol dehydrogenase-like predicted oxidoreductase